MSPLLYNLIWIFGWVLVALTIWYVRGNRRQRRLELIHAERMAAIEKGLPLPELPSYENSESRFLLAPGGLTHDGRRSNPRLALGAGAIFVMAGLGFCAAMFLSGDEYHKQIWPLGLIGVFLGFGLMLHYLLTRPPQQ